MLTIPTTIRDSINQNNGKVVLLSIKKQWLDKILAGEKTIEVRKTRPWEFEYPFTVLCYETKKEGGSGKIVAAFVCDSIKDLDCFTELPVIIDGTDMPTVTQEFCSKGCLSYKELYNYGRTSGRLYGWNVQNVVLIASAVKPLALAMGI